MLIASRKSLMLRLWFHLEPNIRRRLVGLLVLMVVASFAELASIGSVFPFLAVLTTPERIFSHEFSQPLVQLLSLTEPNQLLVPLTLIFLAAVMAATGIRLCVLMISTRLSFKAGSYLSTQAFQRTLYQPYCVHVNRNSSELINGITIQADAAIDQIMRPILLMLSSGIILGTVILGLITFEPLATIGAFGGFALIYALISRLTRRSLFKNSIEITQTNTLRIKALQEALGGIRDILIDSTQSTYCAIYQQADSRLRRAQSQNVFMSESPRLSVEALSMTLIALLALSFASQQENLVGALPLIGALALGAQRLLPLLQQVYQSWSIVRGGYRNLEELLALLDQPLPHKLASQDEHRPLPFKRCIELIDIGFRYQPKGPWVLQNLSLCIQKGSRIGVMGVTGSGKSTLMDILMGLLRPTTGELLVDGTRVNPTNLCSWRAHISHVPQSIFLADASVAENIAFGTPFEDIDSERVRKAAQRAQIAAVIEALPGGYDTIIGERGVLLSGGQRQRIGIARALYKFADVLIFDEATSALDTQTESEVMAAINKLDGDITIVLISHRLSTLDGCDMIVKLGPHPGTFSIQK